MSLQAKATEKHDRNTQRAEKTHRLHISRDCFINTEYQSDAKDQENPKLSDFKRGVIIMKRFLTVGGIKQHYLPKERNTMVKTNSFFRRQRRMQGKIFQRITVNEGTVLSCSLFIYIRSDPIYIKRLVWRLELTEQGEEGKCKGGSLIWRSFLKHFPDHACRCAAAHKHMQYRCFSSSAK